VSSRGCARRDALAAMMRLSGAQEEPVTTIRSVCL
jgi:hypothetical protein